MMASAPVLVDNTVLCNFALVGRPDVVQRLWGTRACTTREVLSEYEAGAVEGLVPVRVWDDLRPVDLTSAEARFASALPPRLGAGERTCLAVAYHRAGIMATDDRDARGVARRFGVPCTGTVGMPVLAVRRGMLTREMADTLLRQMIVLGYRSPVADLAALLD